jgi:hypothetical protein
MYILVLYGACVYPSTGEVSAMSPLSKRDLFGVLRTMAFLAGVFALYVGASWLWERYGSARLGPALGPSLDRMLGSVARAGNTMLAHMADAFLSWIFMPTVKALGHLSPRAGKILSENHILFLPLLIAVILALFAIIYAAGFVLGKIRGVGCKK